MSWFTTTSRIVGLAVLALATSGKTAEPDTTPAPALHVGDSWVFETTTQKGASGFSQVKLDVAVERVDDSTMVVGVRPSGSPAAFEDRVTGLDWSKRELVNGEETTTVRPFVFPMKPGDTWAIDYIDPLRRGAQISNHVRRRYKVVGWQDVTVPAGTFRALKVVADGVDQGSLEVPAASVAGVAATGQSATSVTHSQRGGSRLVTRATHTELYYVPSVKHYVKSLEEQYNDDNVRLLSQSQVLISYKLSN